MIHADLDKILPEEDALEQITTIFNEVEKLRELYVITKSGRPAAAIINIDYLEELTGQEVKQDIAGDVHKEPTNQPVIDEVEPLSAPEPKPTVTSESVSTTVPTAPPGASPDTSDEIEVDEGPLITEEEANKIPVPPTPSLEVTPQTPPLMPPTPQAAPPTPTSPEISALNLPPEQTPTDTPPPSPTVPPLADSDFDVKTNDPANSSPLI